MKYTKENMAKRPVKRLFACMFGDFNNEKA